MAPVKNGYAETKTESFRKVPTSLKLKRNTNQSWTNNAKEILFKNINDFLQQTDAKE